MKCPVCWRERIDKMEYCQYHQAALNNIKSTFDDWKKAMGKLSLNEYLKLLSETPGAGEWVQNVAEHMLNAGKKSRKKKPKQ